MSGLNTEDLAYLRATHEEMLPDKCIICPYTLGEQSDRGKLIESWPETADEIACGLDTQRATEVMLSDKTVIKAHGRIRLPYGTSVDARDRIKITERYGTDDSVLYEVVGPAMKGVSGVLVNVVKVQV